MSGVSQDELSVDLLATEVTLSSLNSKVTAVNTDAVIISSSALPTGASTQALQTTGNESLASVDVKTPALGQALAAASTPVVLTTAQMSTLTPLPSVAVSNLPASQAVTGAFFQATQPVSLLSVPLANNAATETTLATVSTRTGDVTETAPATDTASSGLNGRLQRVAQRLSSIFTSLSDGTQQSRVRGATDGTLIGNSNDRLKVETALPNDYSRGLFGNARVVTTQNVFESLFSFDKQTNVWDEVLTTGGTSTRNVNTNAIDMVTNTASGASVIRQTFRRVRYNPSRTVQYISAGVLGAAKTNVTKRVGQFDSLDGIFFEQDGTGAFVCRRTSTSGAAVDTRVAQSAWNIDKFDGTGPSGVTIDFTKHQAFYFQYAFQGFGDITYGFYLNNQISFCHREQTGNILALPFMRTAHLPCRIEITNTAAAASSTTLSFNSFTVKNEGEGGETEGQVRSYSSGPLRTVGTTVVPVISIRLGASFQRAIVDLVSSNIFVQTSDEVFWTLWLSPTLTGSTFAVNNGFVNIDTAATAMTGGTELVSGILSQNNSSSSVSQDLLKLVNSLIGSSIGGTSQVLTLAARSRVGTADVLSTIVWREYP